VENLQNPPSVYSSIRPRFEVNIFRIQIPKDYGYTMILIAAPLKKGSLRTFRTRIRSECDVRNRFMNPVQALNFLIGAEKVKSNTGASNYN
jgi:hypothetical protein